MKSGVEYSISCPTCAPDQIYTDDERWNTHLVRIFVYNGTRDTEEDGRMHGWKLDGIEMKREPYHDIIKVSMQSGDPIIDVLFKGESCGHYFMRRTYYHKGDVFDSIFPVDGERVANALVSRME